MPPLPRLLLLLLLGVLVDGDGKTAYPKTVVLPLRRGCAAASVHELLRSDRLRQLTIRQRLIRRGALDISAAAAGTAAEAEAEAAAAAEEDSFGMPMTSGAYAGTGQYFVRFLLGTPARPFLLVVDTGSDLTWVKCRLHGGRRRHRVFHPASSKTFRIIPCAAETCKNDLPFSLSACPTPASPCRYDYKYSDESSAQGVYANESATVILAGRRRAKLRGLVVGCTATFSGASFSAADGVLGLGNSGSSFAARAAASFGGGFSYCLVDHLSLRNASSFLRFGPARPPAAAPVHETPLVLDMQPFYGVGIMGISIDGKMLAIPAIVWDFASGGGTIVDSGTSLTLLAEPAYGLVAGALSRRLAWAPRVSMDPFEFCYNWTAATAEEKAGPVPAMVVHLAGGARLDPPAKSYVIDVADGVKCLGIQPSPWPGISTLGNILQQEHLWEFDVANQRLRFSRSTCHAH